MKWPKQYPSKKLIGGILAAFAAACGIQFYGGQETERIDMRCKCIWYNDVTIVEEGVNKK